MVPRMRRYRIAQSLKRVKSDESAVPTGEGSNVEVPADLACVWIEDGDAYILGLIAEGRHPLIASAERARNLGRNAA